MDFYERKVKATKFVLDLFDKGFNNREINKIICLNFGLSDRFVNGVLLKFRANGKPKSKADKEKELLEPKIMD